MSKTPSPWSLRKDELVAELRRRDLVVHESWSVPELRTLLVEHRRLEGQDDPVEVKGISKMSHQQLMEECRRLDIKLPEKPTRGHMMLLIRDMKKSPAHTVLSFGRYKGWHYSEVPKGYQEWAIAETSKNENATQDLVRFAKWAKENLAMKESRSYPNKDLARDPEALAVIPPPAMEMESEGSIWSRVSSRASRKGRRDSDMEVSMPSPDPQAEMAMLERRLEALKRQEKEKNMR